jgi:CTP:molybdopterin cytidylyltransferase MocA
MLRWFRCPQKRLNSPPIWRDSPFRHSSGGINAKTIKSKVLIVNHGYPPQFSGGSEAYAQTLALQLLKSGRCEEVNVMAREHDPFRDDGRDASTRLVEKSPRKAVIPIAGKGTRMGPQSAVTPKALLPLPFGKNDIRPALTCLLNQLLATDTGLQEVCLVVAPNQMQIVEQYLASLDSQGCAAGSGNVSIVLQDTPLGLGDAVLAAQHFVDNEPFLLALGDHWFTPGVATQFLAAYRTLVTTLGASARDRVGLTGACLCTEDEIPLTGLLQTTCDVNGALNPEGVSLVLNMCENSTDPLQYKKYAVPSSLESSYLSQLVSVRFPSPKIRLVNMLPYPKALALQTPRREWMFFLLRFSVT